MLLRLIASVEALCRSAEKVGWIIPVTPSRMSSELNETIVR